MVYLVMRLRHGNHLAVPMEEDQANSYIAGWMAGHDKTGFVQGLDPDAGRWAVKTEEIQLMHTQPIPKQPPSQSQQPVAHSPFWPNVSGRN